MGGLCQRVKGDDDKAGSEKTRDQDDNQPAQKTRSLPRAPRSRESEDEGEDRYLVPDTSVARSKTSLFPKTLASTT